MNEEDFNTEDILECEEEDLDFFSEEYQQKRRKEEKEEYEESIKTYKSEEEIFLKEYNQYSNAMQNLLNKYNGKINRFSKEDRMRYDYNKDNADIAKEALDEARLNLNSLEESWNSPKERRRREEITEEEYYKLEEDRQIQEKIRFENLKKEDTKAYFRVNNKRALIISTITSVIMGWFFSLGTDSWPWIALATFVGTYIYGLLGLDTAGGQTPRQNLHKYMYGDDVSGMSNYDIIQKEKLHDVINNIDRKKK